MNEWLKRISFKDIILGLLGTIRDHYIFVFLFSAFLMNPSKRLLFIAFVGLVINHLILNIAHNWRQMISVFLAFQSRVKPMLEDGTIKVQKYLVSDFIQNKETFELLEDTTLFKMATLGRGLNNMIHIYSSSIPRNSKTIQTNVVCFARPFAEGYVFVDVTPDKMNFFQRFKVLHEVGHALLSPFSMQQKRQGGLFGVLMLLLLVIATLDLTMFPWLILLVYGTIVLARLVYKFVDWFYSDFKDEVFADLFGLCALSDEERMEVSKMKKLHYFVNNKRMLQWHQNTRLQVLKYNLKLSTQDDIKGLGAINKMVEYTFTLIAPKFLPLIISIFWMSFYFSLAYFGNFNEDYLTNKVLKYTFGIVLIIFIIIRFLNNFNHKTFIKVLQQRIANQPQSFNL